MARSHWLLLAIPVLMLMGCATEYAPPPAGVPTANLTLSTTSYGSVSIVGASAATCPSPAKTTLAGFSFTLAGASLAESARRTSPVRVVPAEKPYHVSATIAGTTCTLSASFMPKAAGEYEAVLHATNNVCRLQIYRRAAPGTATSPMEPEPSARPNAQIKDLCA